MTQHHKCAVFLFTRDLRTSDNTSLIELTNKYRNTCYILPLFIFNPEQVGANNAYRSAPAIRFMCECLADLQTTKIPDMMFYQGNPATIIARIHAIVPIQAIALNHDYTPFAIAREEALLALSKKIGADFICRPDYLLLPEFVLNKSNQVYVKFSPFHRAALAKRAPDTPTALHSVFASRGICAKFSPLSLSAAAPKYASLLPRDYSPNVVGGRSHALTLMKHIASTSIARTYLKSRDYPAASTTNLSAYIKYGTVSIREVYYFMRNTLKLPKNHALIKQLYWREFYTVILHKHPRVLGHAMRKSYSVKWSHDMTKFAAWTAGKTGFPLVDAGMRQIAATGYMHNRVRMVVADFLIKLLHIDWRIGEKYFATQLIDYDTAVNNGSWQWQAGSGTDSQPYYRIYNPWIQAYKFDRECEYIKKWVPELRDVPPKDIIKWNKTYKEYTSKGIYIAPIIDYVKEKKIAIKLLAAVH